MLPCGMEPEAPQETPVPEEPIIELLNEILGQEQTEQVDIDALEKKYCVTSVDRVEKLTAAVLELLARRSKAGEHLKPAGMAGEDCQLGTGECVECPASGPHLLQGAPEGVKWAGIQMTNVRYCRAVTNW